MTSTGYELLTNQSTCGSSASVLAGKGQAISQLGESVPVDKNPGDYFLRDQTRLVRDLN
jgi:hypothetical protein